MFAESFLPASFPVFLCPTKNPVRSPVVITHRPIVFKIMGTAKF